MSNKITLKKTLEVYDYHMNKVGAHSTPGTANLKDVQSESSTRNLDIDMVGVKGLRYPMSLETKKGGNINTVATFSLFVHLPRDFRGTHMSRFVEILNEYHSSMSPRMLEGLVKRMVKKLSARSAFISMKFPYFLEKKAPITKKRGQMDYNCVFTGLIDAEGYEGTLKVEVPVTSCCPCSKEISLRGAHNQRVKVSVKVRLEEDIIWIEDLCRIVEDSASCELFSLLKREDEKYVTEKAYDSPMFVEDIVREVAHKMGERGLIPYKIDAESQESIHNHSAFAMIKKGVFR